MPVFGHGFLTLLGAEGELEPSVLCGVNAAIFLCQRKIGKLMSGLSVLTIMSQTRNRAFTASQAASFVMAQRWPRINRSRYERMSVS